MPLVKAQGIVMKQINLGEADKIITLFTDRIGKIQAVAHGARKPKSKFLASTQLFSYGEYVMYKGRSLYTINQADVKESFQNLLGDLYTLTYCSYILELSDVLTQNDERNTDLFALILKTFYLMSEGRIDRDILTMAFEIKSMSISGYMPGLYRCMICDTDNKLTAFLSQAGGLVCEKCADTSSNSIRIDRSTINIMRYILKTPLEKLNTIRISIENKNEIKKVMKDYIKYYLEREFKSLDFLNDIKSVENL
ncbi:MAG: DNA repair protein RecO [Clostridiales bacterium]|nr:DNA repair protein RecO [Clostridiales bacterium]HBM81254.1 DNA repair protein RecO [Clostridiaceae bacterium]